jgi:hypothetical protein
MSPLRYRDEDHSTSTTIASIFAGAVAGFTIGMIVSKRVGGWSGLRRRLRDLVEGPAEATRHGAEVGEYYDEGEYVDGLRSNMVAVTAAGSWSSRR